MTITTHPAEHRNAATGAPMPQYSRPDIPGIKFWSPETIVYLDWLASEIAKSRAMRKGVRHG